MDGEDRAKASDPPAGQVQIETREDWTHLQQAASSLPEEERELVHFVSYLGAKWHRSAKLLDWSD